MRTKEFLGKLEHERIVQAIRESESKTSGEIRIFLQRGLLADDPVEAAGKKFHALGMHKTAARNGVLIFIAPRAHKFAVIGDAGIHEKCGEALWQGVVGKMRQHFQQEHFTDAIVEAVSDLGSVLADQFPRQPGDKNELPDAIIEEE